ncbi:hypothetical protein FNAPI_12427 [Fusarium napiforme]|uniref:Uncharacterized protein n=1 Tax=Fusarium napiforme TaxID=42672 RepID=A0A8H5ML95_9HYPO|nr:hypothetical protein FNAPI_12427 [Fusarium napiforme]
MDYSSILSKPKSFFGKQKVWMARGEDLALFNTHRPNLQNLLRHSCIPESSHNLWIGLYRIGTTEDEAKTFVVVSCTDRRIRRLTRDILSSCPIFQPGQALDRFKVISKATLPETACEPRPTMQDEQELECEPGLRNEDKGKNIANDEYKTIRISPSITGDRYLCRQVQARHVCGKGEVRFQTATAGPLINVDGRTYQLTVAHVVNFETKDIHDTIESTTEDWDDWDEESDDDVNSGCSVDEDVASWDISASRNSTPDASDNGIPSSLSSDSALEVATQQGESGIAITEATSPNEITIDEPVHPPSSTHPHLSKHPILEEFLVDHVSPNLGFAPGSENCQISSEMDYLLIPTNTDLQAGASPSKGAELVQTSDAFDLQYETDARSIIIATASLGYMEGVGTSGSAVFDKETGLLAGHIVLGCPEKNIWYMLPIVSVLLDLEIRFGQRGNCQIKIDVAAAMGSLCWHSHKSQLQITLLAHNLDIDTTMTDQWVAAAMSLNMIGMETANLEEPTELTQGFSDGPEIPEDQGSSQHVVSKLPSTTNWGKINRPIEGILKALRTENPIHLDQLSNRFGQSTHSPERDRRLLARFRNMESAFLETMALIISHPQTTSEDHQMAEISQTPANSLATTEISETVKTCNHDRKADPQPTAWMVNIFGPGMDKGAALERRETLALLQGKNLSSHNPDHEAYTPRCLYIKNPDPKRIVALYKVSSRFPMEPFQQLLFSYVTKQPEPMIKITQDVSNYQSFLRSERYWTAACLNDGLTDDTMMLSTKVEADSKYRTKPMSPRAYALEALATSLEKIVRYHRQIQLTVANALILSTVGQDILSGQVAIKTLASLSHYCGYKSAFQNSAMSKAISRL